MGIGVAILLIAIGAILAFAVHVTTQGIDLSTIGVILMVVGVVGLIADMILLGDRRPLRRRAAVVDRGPEVVARPVDPVVEERYVEEAVPTRRRVVRREIY
ncbi:MAG: DUF6458 family protein [Actinobacteria bacterium]|nr:DUF6458 family protein [Actinomycetota bacterium]